MLTGILVPVLEIVGWRAVPPVPTWVNPVEYKADINKKRPYVDCPAWEINTSFAWRKENL